VKRTWGGRAQLSTALLAAFAAVGSALMLATPAAADPGDAPAFEPALSVPAALPDHFGFGLNSNLHNPESGPGSIDRAASWDYRYVYLNGGVSDGKGWRTWGENARFPIDVAQISAQSGSMPVFTYYQILGAGGPCNGCDEKRTDLENLNNPATMANYYRDFTLLMKRLGAGTYDGLPGYGGRVIVHVEPDLAGMMQQAVSNGICFGYCTGQGNDPALVKASVASSGVADVSAYPDTFQGFNWALLHLRDLYAPNVLLAFHVSNWATNVNVESDPNPSLDAVALGERVGAFAARAGAVDTPRGTSTYDLLFNDVADREAGYRATVERQPTFWWDRDNIALPNFHRWEQYIGGATRVTGKPLLVWQAPLGNQYFRTENNTSGHYQDNKVEYFFSHPDELVQAGIIGVMFARGGGGSGNTALSDAMSDGITNPAPFCTSDGISNGKICNDHVSDSADDDGGYLRLVSQQYYRSGPFAFGASTWATRQLP
jgi:hypothetical protein